jgi:hypothetical protein
MPPPQRARALRALAAALALAGLPAGCGLVPRSAMNDARNRVQALQAENQELRDVAVNLRAVNKDMAQRAVDDSRRLRGQEEAIARYERVIADYQDEREQTLALLDQIRSQVRAAASAPPTTAMLEGLDAFARAHPGCTLDARDGALAIPAGVLFAPGTADLRPEGSALLDALGARLATLGGAALGLSIAADGGDGPDGVRLASARPDADARAALGLQRARRLRDNLAARAGLDPARVAVSPGGRTPLGADGVRRAGGGADAPVVTVRVRRVGATAETGDGIDP